MGCGPQREKIETEMLLLRLTRTQIQEERAEIIKELEKMSGEKIIRANIPDYLHHPKEEEKTTENELKSSAATDSDKKKNKRKESKEIGYDKKIRKKESHKSHKTEKEEK